MNNNRHKLIMKSICESLDFPYLLDGSYKPKFGGAGVLLYFYCSDETMQGTAASNVTLLSLAQDDKYKHAIFINYAEESLKNRVNQFGMPEEFISKVTDVDELTLPEVKKAFMKLLHSCKGEAQSLS